MNRSDAAARARRLWSIGGLAMMVCLSSVGCGKSNWGYVEGVVTLQEKPTGPGTLIFEPIDPAQTTSARGHFGEDGKYEISTPGNEPGMPVGEYRVSVFGGGEGQFGDEQFDQRKESAIPTRYQLNSDLTATVKEGDNTINFDLKP